MITLRSPSIESAAMAPVRGTKTPESLSQLTYGTVVVNFSSQCICLQYFKMLFSKSPIYHCHHYSLIYRLM